MLASWPQIIENIEKWRVYPGDEALRDKFLARMTRCQTAAGGYLRTIHSLTEDDKAPGRAWLAGFVDQMVTALTGMLPGLFDAP